MFQFLLKLLRKATCDAILGGVDDAMDQLGEINDGSERTTTLRDRVLALTKGATVVEAEAITWMRSNKIEPKVLCVDGKIAPLNRTNAEAR